MTDNTTDTKVQVADTLATAAEALNNSKNAPPVKGKWAVIKDMFIRYCGALVLERDRKDRWVISTGKVAFWLAFLPALYIFIDAFLATKNITTSGQMVSRDITPNHLTILLSLMGYNLSKKVADVAHKVIDNKSNGPG